MWLRNLYSMATRKFAFQEDLFCIVMVLLPVLLYLSLTGQSAASPLPADFISMLVKAGVLTCMPDVDMTALDLVRNQLSEETFASLANGCDNFLDCGKFNPIPMALNPTDAFLQLAICGSNNKDFKVTLLACIMARRFLNESSHLLLVLEGYQFYTHNPRADSSGFIRFVGDAEFSHSYAHVVESMLQTFNSRALACAVKDTIQIMGVQPRTGYLCGPLQKRQIASQLS